MREAADESFDEFVRARSSALLRSAYLLTTDRYAAEDLLQDVLERVYVKWRRIQDSPEAYARRVLVNRAVDGWRRRGHRQEVELGDGLGPSDSDHADEVAIRHAILVALRSLPKRQRTAVVLRYLDDLSETDTAHAMGCSVGAVKSHAARGLAKLRGVLPSSSSQSSDLTMRSAR
ncbi:SigE family RNA polymerase sigma factor [Micromonospora globbae]|uniref:SigE family RNA polymerase sigma factor n=1 Tax=Micromonospora globbae TaxID=1894969 RepID=UPI0034153133